MRPVAAIPLLTLVGLGVWLLARGSPPTVMPIDDAPRAAPPTSPPPAQLPVAMGSDLVSAPSKAPPKPGDHASVVTEIRYGAVTLTLVSPNGEAIPKSLSFDAQPLEFNYAQKSLPAAQDDGTWRYDRLPAGRWRVRAFVPGFVDVSKDIDIRPDGEARISLPLEVGGAAAWKVALTTRQVPEFVQVSLLDGRGIPIGGTYQTAATTLHAEPSKAPALPAEGAVVGLKVGRYRLRVSTLDGEPKEQAFEVKAGETVTLEFTLPR